MSLLKVTRERYAIRSLRLLKLDLKGCLAHIYGGSWAPECQKEQGAAWASLPGSFDLHAWWKLGLCDAEEALQG